MSPANTTSILIDVRELAAMLAISVPTAWRMRESGRLPEPLRLTAQCVRWRRTDINSWLAAGCPSIGAADAMRGPE